MPASDITLRLPDGDLGGWTATAVVLTLEAVARAFRLDYIETQPGNPERRRIRPGAECSVLVDGETVLTGLVDGVGGQYNDSAHGVTARGRSRVAQLVDCSPPSTVRQWDGLTLEQLATELASPFGVAVSSDVVIAGTLGTWVLEQGETPYQTIARAARSKGVRPVDDGSGGLKFTQLAPGKSTDAIERDRNVIECTWDDDATDRFSEVTVLGQQRGTKWGKPSALASPVGQAFDANVTLYRPLTVLADAPGDSEAMQLQAEWEVANRAGAASTTTYVVGGWRQLDAQGKPGELWRPNLLVPVHDADAGRDGEFVVSGVSFGVGSQGQRTSIEIKVPESLVPKPLTETKRGGKVWKSESE